MSRLKIVAIAVPLTWYVFIALASRRYAWAAEYWWITSGIATFVGFGLCRLSQSERMGGDGGEAEQLALQNWVPVVVGPIMFIVGLVLLGSSLGNFGDPWSALAGACIALLGACSFVAALRQRRV
jgi:hypothetical protein